MDSYNFYEEKIRELEKTLFIVIRKLGKVSITKQDLEDFKMNPGNLKVYTDNGDIIYEVEDFKK